jgi:hypothetical protein
MEIQDLLGYTVQINVIIVGRAILSGEDSVTGYAVPRFLECLTAEKHDKSDLQK